MVVSSFDLQITTALAENEGQSLWMLVIYITVKGKAVIFLPTSTLPWTITYAYN